MQSVIIRDLRSRIGKAIHKLRDEEKISAEYLAKVLGVTQSTISRIENGITSIPAEKLCYLAKSYNRPLSYFIGEKSSLTYDNEDILRAALSFYGAQNLKHKRTINVNEHYKTYTSFLNDALVEVDDPRFAAALAVTLYKQARENQLKTARIIATVQHEQLLINLSSLISVILESRQNIKRPMKEINLVFLKLSEISDVLKNNIKNESYQSTLASIDPVFVANFINENLNAIT